MITGLHSICDKSTLKIFIVMICECLKIKNIDDDTQYRKLYCYNFCIIGNGKKTHVYLLKAVKKAIWTLN